MSTPVKAPRSSPARYRIHVGMFAWLMHRLTGIGLVLYLILHVWGLKSLSNKEAFNALISGYHAPIFKFGEFLLLVAVTYHAVNGLRIVLIDFLGWSPRQKRLFWTLGGVALLIIVIGGYPSLSALWTYFFG